MSSGEEWNEAERQAGPHWGWGQIKPDKHFWEAEE